jgi:DNA-binding CsgD family transcriptional regulator
MTAAVVVLRAALTVRELRVLHELVEAPAYKIVAQRMQITVPGVRFHIANIVRKLPDDWFPSSATKDRVVFYAQRQHALAQLGTARENAA